MPGRFDLPPHVVVARDGPNSASDEDLHDAVLVGAAFCGFNRYVDGLAANTPTDPAVHKIIGRDLANNGYRAPAPQP